MKIKIKFFGFLATKIGRHMEMNVEGGAALGNVIAEIFEKHDLGHFDPESSAAESGLTPGSLRVFLNQKEAPFNHKLKEGDEVFILPPLVGGRF